MAAPIFESFSITHAAILNGTTGADKADIYGVRSGSIDIDSDSYSNTGDDTILSVWNWFNLASLTIESGFISFDTVSYITSAAITSSGSVPNDYWNLPLWNIGSLNVPPLSVKVRTSARKSNGETGYLDFILYKVQFQPISFDGPSYKNGLSATLNGQCLMSSKDELGNTLTDPAVGRLAYTGHSIIVSALQVVDNGDGTFTITGTGLGDNMDGTFTISADQLIDNGNGTYTIL